MNRYYCCCYDERTDAHIKIEEQIQLDRKRKKKEIQIMFLGKSRSGKTTLLRQMQIIYGHEYTNDEINYFKQNVYSNLVMAVQTVIRAMTSFQISLQDESNKEVMERVCCVDTYDMRTVSEELAISITQLLSDSGLQSYLNSGHEILISDSDKYFIENMDRIFKPDYSPSEQDIVRVRIPTCGIQEYAFEQNGRLFRLTDFRGLYMYSMSFRTRQVWFQFVQSTHVIFYVADVSVFNKTLEGSDNENEVEECVALFKSILSHPWLSGTCFVLFLNKMDLLGENLTKCDLSDHFPAYSGPKNDFAAASNFLMNLFLEASHQHNTSIYPHFTCAVDTSAMKIVFDDFIRSTIQLNLRKSTLL